MRLRLFKLIAVSILAFLLCRDCWAAFGQLNPNQLRDGDLIFQTSASSQSRGIIKATGSLYSHMGIIKKTGNHVMVVEASGPVRETPFTTWIHRGILGRFMVVRHRKMTDSLAKPLLLRAKHYYGQPYDPYFLFNNGRLYCSELPYLLYQQIGISIGKVQKISELNTGNQTVEQLMQARWKTNPVCRNRKSFGACQSTILHQKLITPVSIAQDPNMVTIFSNYPPAATSLVKVSLSPL